MLSRLAMLLLLGWLTQASAQVLSAGPCTTYRGTPDFDGTFVNLMKVEERSYLILMSSGPELACQRLKFFPNETVTYTYTTSNGIEQTSTGKYSATAYSPQSPGTLELRGFPINILGTGLGGTVSLKVLAADEEQLTASSCIDIGGLHLETVTGLVREEKFLADRNATTERLQKLITSMQFSRPQEIKLQSQFCGVARGDVLKVYDKLVKFGIIPDIPFLRDIIEKLLGLISGDDTDERMLYSALREGLLPATPTYQLTNALPGHSPASQPGYVVPSGLVQQQPYTLVTYGPGQHQSYTFPPSSIPVSQFYPTVQYDSQFASQFNPNVQYQLQTTPQVHPFALYHPQVTPQVYLSAQNQIKTSPQSFVYPPFQTIQSSKTQTDQKAKFSVPSQVFGNQLGFRPSMQATEPKVGSITGSSLVSNSQYPVQAFYSHAPANNPILSQLLALKSKK